MEIKPTLALPRDAADGTDGTVVHMEKRLAWADDALITQLDIKIGGWSDR